MCGHLEEQPERAAEYHSLHLPMANATCPPLVLLHGSNGDEHDLLDLAGEVAPGASRFALRGDVALRPGYAFFRRFTDRRIDVEDLRILSARPAQFIRVAVAHDHGGVKPIAIGYSNGAVMATALLLDAPEALAGAVLLRPLLPRLPTSGTTIGGKPVLIIDGLQDQRRAPEDGEFVREALQRAGAVVQHETSASGHAIGPDDLRLARTWDSRLRTS